MKLNCMMVCGVLSACGQMAAGPVPSGDGRVFYALPQRDTLAFFSLAAAAGSTPVPLGPVFDRVSAGHDEKFGVNRTGTFAAVDTTRFGCDGYACLARVALDGSAGEKVAPAGNELHVYATAPAISAAGDLIVFTQQDDATNAVHLHVTRRVNGTWGEAIRLTAGSSYQYNRSPSLSADDRTVVFGCSNDADESTGNSICTVNVDGTGFSRRLSFSDGPSGGRNLYHPVYAPDSSIVFEGEWGTEQIWKLAPGSSTPSLLHSAHTNDNTPCVLPSGKVASLWLGRMGNASGAHELKRMNADGTDDQMLLTGTDIADVGLGCSQ